MTVAGSVTGEARNTVGPLVQTHSYTVLYLSAISYAVIVICTYASYVLPVPPKKTHTHTENPHVAGKRPHHRFQTRGFLPCLETPSMRKNVIVFFSGKKGYLSQETSLFCKIVFAAIKPVEGMQYSFFQLLPIPNPASSYTKR